MNALIVGCGKISSEYDSPDGSRILTHAHAFSNIKAISDFAFVDIDKERLSKACRKWSVQGFSDLGTAIDCFSPEIVCIATPPNVRLELFEILVKKGIKKIICEKPISLDIETANEIAKITKKNNLVVNVNYPRRFDPSVVDLKNKIDQNEYGSIQGVRCLYTKGIINSGSHLINLLLFLLGKYKGGLVYGELYDHDPDDPSLQSIVRFEKSDNVQLMGVDHKNYFLFECEFLFEKARVILEQRGFSLSVQLRREDPVFSGYYDLSMAAHSTTSLDKALMAIINETLNDNVVSSVDEAVDTFSICSNLIINRGKGHIWES